MTPQEQTAITVVLSLLSGALIPIVKLIFDKMSSDRNANLNDNIAFAKEWRELYQKMESKVTRLEETLAQMQMVNDSIRKERDGLIEKNRTLEKRVGELEAKFAQLGKAFEYLVSSVDPTSHEHVEAARKIARGDDSWLNS